MTDKINESGAGEATLSPGAGSAGGDIKTKSIADIITKLAALSPDDLNGFKASLDQIGHEADSIGGDAASKNKNSISAKPSDASTKGMVKEDLAKIFGGEETLSEDFIDKAATLFEAAVVNAVAIEAERLEEELDAAIETRTNELQEQFADRVDSYLDYISEKYLEDNQVAIETGVRVELAESFLKGIVDLVSEHNVDIDADKIDVVAALEEKVASLESDLHEAVDANGTMAREIEEREIRAYVNTVTEGMTESDRDRLVLVSESIDFSDVDQFKEKFATIKDSLFSESATAPEGSNGLVIEEVEEVATPPVLKEDVAPKATPVGNIGRVMDTISKQVRR